MTYPNRATTPTTELSATTGENQALIEAARLGAQPHPLEAGKVWVVATANGDVKQIDLTGDQWLDAPRHLRGTVKVSHGDSLRAYWDKHNDDSSDVFADRESRTITAVLDANHGSADVERARWQHHRAVLTLAYSDPFKAWLAINGKLQGQEDFAEFLEDHGSYVTDPVAADLIEMVQFFQAHTTAQFKSGFKLVNGQRQLSYTEHIEGSTQINGGTVEMPTSLTIRVPVWRGANDPTEFTARLRTRMNHGGTGRLGIGIKLDRATETVDAAFEAEVQAVEEHIGRHVLRGTPAGA